jgi:hypothetical protein
MASFDDYWVKLHIELVEFAMYGWRSARDAAISDGKDFLEKTKVDINLWFKLLEERKITHEDFALLLTGKKNLAELAALRRKGLSEAALERFVTGLIEAATSPRSISLYKMMFLQADIWISRFCKHPHKPLFDERHIANVVNGEIDPKNCRYFSA